MPDLAPLPPLGPTPPFAPDQVRFAATARVARRRRALRTSVPLGAVAVVAAITVLSAGASTPSGLTPVAPATQPPAPTPWVTVSAGPDGARAEAGFGPSPSASPSPSDAPALPPASEEPSPDPEPSDDVRVMTRATLAMVPYDATDPCHADSADRVNGWCARDKTPASVPSGGFVDLVFDICRTQSTAGTLRFPAEEEIGFTLMDQNGDAIASLGATAHPGTDSHTIDVGGVTCARWTVPWRVADDNGRPLAPGTYQGGWFDRGTTYYHQGVIVNDDGRGALSVTVQ